MAGVVLFVLLALPFVELAVFIAAVGWIGFLPALAGIIVVGLVGGWLVKRQGLGVWRRADGRLRSGEVPSAEVVNGLLVLVAGGLLLFPGFVSDVIAIALLVPPVRALVRSLLFRRFEQRVTDHLAAPVGLAFGTGAARRRIDTGPATYGSTVDVREVENPTPDAPGPAGRGRP